MNLTFVVCRKRESNLSLVQGMSHKLRGKWPCLTRIVILPPLVELTTFFDLPANIAAVSF